MSHAALSSVFRDVDRVPGQGATFARSCRDVTAAPDGEAIQEGVPDSVPPGEPNKIKRIWR